MICFDIKDIDFQEVISRDYDICIFSTGYEKRARFLLSKIYKNILPKIPIKICFSFSDYEDLFDRKINDALFSENNFETLNVDKYIYGEISRKLKERLNKFNFCGRPVKILIDYTVMRRGWYSEVLQFFNMLSEDGINILITFSYTCGSYIGKKELKIVKDYALVPGFEGVGSQKKEKFGVYSLGFEPISVQSLHDWVEPSEVSCIVANPGAKEGSGDKCLKLNKSFIEEFSDEVIETPLSSVRNYCDLLTDIIKQKSYLYDIVLFGGGPKPFVLGNFLCSLLRPTISNIYINGPESNPINVESAGSFVITDMQFN